MTRGTSSPAARAKNIASAWLLACGIAAGGLCAAAIAPADGNAGSAEGYAIVQTAQAKTSASKAKAAYRAFLGSGAYQWQQFRDAPGLQNPGSYSFATGDINGGGVPELFIQNNRTPYSSGYARAYTYWKGKAKLIGKFSMPPAKIYTKGHALYSQGMHTGFCWGSYFKLSKGKLVKMAEWQGTFLKEYAKRPLRKADGVYYTSCKIGSKQKSTSYKKYSKYVRKLVKAKKMPRELDVKLSMAYHKNAPGNRSHYL